MLKLGASFHITPHDELFTSYSRGDFGNVKMGNSDASKTLGIGDIWFETNLKYELLPKDVRYVPDMCLNLISIGKLDDEGFVN